MSGTDMRQTIRDAADLLEQRLKSVPSGVWTVASAGEGRRSPEIWASMEDGTGQKLLSVHKEFPEVGEYIGAVQPTVARHLVTLLRTEAASTAGDEDHTSCTAETCATVAAYELAISLVGEP